MAKQANVDQQKDQHAWQGKPVVAFIIRAFAFTSPIIASVIASIWLSRVLPQPQSLGELVRWWAMILTGSTLVLFGVNWGARRLLPLAALMRLTMVFPDKAPRRFRTALKSGSSVRHLKAQIEEAERLGSSGDQDRAAEFILQLSNALNTHDRRTRGHAERVRAYAEMLAEEMDLNVDDKSKLRWASLLHDIGKLKISPDILNKPGRLNDEEWIEIKKHPSHGADICAPLLDWLGNFANTIEDHHERFDGNGYPNGKKGDEISIGGRIVSVADAYDVMTTVRSYKAAMPANAAREELARNAGGQFDPVVVRAFLNISMGRLRWVAGPLSWLAQLPFLRFVGAVQQVGTAVGVAGVTATGVAAVVGAGIVDVPGTEYLELPTVPGIQAAVVPGPTIDAANDSITSPEDSRVSFNPLANDSGAGVITIVDAPDFGRVVINEDGTVTYTPDEDYFGEDEFTYNLVGDEGASDSAVVKVTVTPTNDAPVARDDTATTDEDTPVAIAVLANDSDVEGLDAASVVITAQGLNGFAVFDPGSGVITYTPNPDFSGTDAFRYQVADTAGVVAEARVTVNVAPVNDEPVAEDDVADVDEDGSIVVDVVANDADPEGALDFDSLVVAIAPSEGTVTVVGGALTYEPDDDFYGADSLTYEICDDEGLCDTASVAITVTAVNDAPTVPGPGAVTTDEDVSVDIDLMAGVSDIDGDDLTMTVDIASANVAAVVNHGDGTVTYWPPPDYYGTDTFSFVVSDGVESVTFEVTVTVGEVNDAPVVPGPGPLLVTEDTMFSFDPVAGATDVDGDIVTLDSFDAMTAAGGTVAVGSLEYTPPADFSGPDSFEYTVTDGRGAFVTVAVSITVDPVNDAPVGSDEAYLTDEDTAVFVAAPGVLGNDTDVEGDTLSAIPAGAPANGVLSMSGDGSFTYTPNPDFSGVDSFDYTVSDGLGGTAVATVSIEVQPKNDAPVAVDDVVTVPEDSVLLVDASANDTDVEDGVPAGATALVVGPVNGAVLDNGDGTFTYTPNAEFNGSDQFTYTIDDSEGATSNAATVSISVTAVNDAPALAPIGPLTSDELAAISFTASASDADTGDALTFSLVGGVPSGAAINPTTGAFTWTPTEAEGPGVYAFDVVVTDDGSPPLTDSETITIAINEVNVAPALDPIAPQVGDELTLITFTATASDADLPSNALTFSLAGPVPAGAVIDPSTGVFSWTPADAQDGLHSFDVVVTDSGAPALADSQTIEVSVNDVNSAPALDPIGDKSIDELATLSFVATASDSDLPADTLAFSLSGAPAGASINPITGAFSWTPTDSQDGDHVFDVVVTDDGSPILSDAETITVTVNEVNGAPVLDPVGPQSGDELTAITFTATAADSDSPPDALTFSLSGTVPAGASINPVTGAFAWTPTEAQDGVYSFDVVVTDDGSPNLGDSETITVTVNEVNAAPIVTNPGDRASGELDVVSLFVIASDPDLPPNTLTFSDGGTLPLGLSIDSSTGEISGLVVPGAAAFSPYTVTITATETDGVPANLFDAVTFDWTVVFGNNSPLLDPVGPQSGDELTPITFTASATDPNVLDTLTFSLSGEPAGASINPATGAFTWTPTEAQDGVHSFDVVVTDDGTPSLNDSETITVTVNEANTAPVLGAVGAQSGDELTAITFTATATDGDVPANGLTFSLSGAPAGASINPVTGAFSWTPTEAEDGMYSFDVVVTDDGTPSLDDTETITVTVNEANTAPVLGAVGAQSGDELTAITFTATATDGDVPANGLTFSLAGPVPAGASINPATGAFTWTPTEAQDGVHSFDVVVTDDGTPSLDDTETITVTVNDVNTAPVLGAVGAQSGDELTAITFTATASDSDLPADTLAFSLTGGVPAGASINPVTGAFSWTPTEAEDGVYSFDVVVTDDGTPSLNDSETITVTVNEVNTAPVLGAVGAQSGDELTAITFTATATDSDVPANGLTFSLSAVPAGASINPVTGAFSWTPTEAQDGVYSFDVVVTDDGTPSLNDSETITVTVNEVNVAPILDPIPDPSYMVTGTANTLTITATDADLAPNTLTIGAVGVPAWATFADYGNGTADITGTPGAAEIGSYPITVTVSDGSLNDSQPFTLEVVTGYYPSPWATKLVINEILIQQGNASKEFIEIYNASSGAVDLEGWTLADWNMIEPDDDGIDPIEGTPDYFTFTFPAGAILPADGYAVIWTGDNSPALQASPNVSLQYWIGVQNQLKENGDDVWLYDDAGLLVDYVAFGKNKEINTPPSPLAMWWDASNQIAIGNPGAGVTISLTPNGVDSNDSNCWEGTASGDSTCGPITVDNWGSPPHVSSPGENNNVAYGDLAVTKTVDDVKPSRGETVRYTVTLTNLTTNATNGIVVNDLLPAGVSHAGDDSAGTYDPVSGDWSVGTLADSASAVLNIDVTVTAARSTTVDNTATVTAMDRIDVVPTNDTDTAGLTVNRRPSAVDDSATANESELLVIDVLGNDSDPDGDPVSMLAWDPVSVRGAYVDCSAGTCDYTAIGIASPPDDTFSYTISDGDGETATGTVTVTITPEAGTALFLKTDGTAAKNRLLAMLPAPFVPFSTGAIPDMNDGTDGDPGRKLERAGGDGIDQTDTSKYQTWAFVVADAGGLALNGNQSLVVYVAVKDFATDKAGEAIARLSSCPGGAPNHSNGCTHLGAAAVAFHDPWTPSGGWRRVVLDFGSVGPVVIPSSDELRVKLVAGSNSDEDLWVAYDTVATPSRFRML